jgi:hypothetical protein
MPIDLDSGDYDAVRHAIHVGIDSDALPDAWIVEPHIGAVAEAYINGRLVANPDATLARAALIVYTAALLCPRVPVITNEREAGGGVTIQGYDPTKRQMELFAESAQLVSAANGNADSLTPIADLMPAFFRIASVVPER